MGTRITPSNFRRYEENNPFMAYNHIEICSAGPEMSIVKVTLQPESKNLNGTAHGGLIYALADCVTGVSARAEGDNFVTQCAHINFLRNTDRGTIYAKSTTLRRGRQLAVFQVEITDDSGRLLAEGDVNMARVEKPFTLD